MSQSLVPESPSTEGAQPVDQPSGGKSQPSKEAPTMNTSAKTMEELQKKLQKFII